jgi:hypothetical protein
MAMALPRRSVELISQAKDPKKTMMDLVGDISGVQLLWNLCLVAVYIRPERRAGSGIIRPFDNVIEDLWQGKVGLMLKHGPTAYQDDDYNKFKGQTVPVGSWCAMKINEAWQCEINGVGCRVLEDSHVKMIISDPNMVF